MTDDLIWGFRIDTTDGKYEITPLPPVSARSLGVELKRRPVIAKTAEARPVHDAGLLPQIGERPPLSRDDLRQF